MRGTPSARLSAFLVFASRFHPIIAATPAPDFLPQVTYPYPIATLFVSYLVSRFLN